MTTSTVKGLPGLRYFRRHADLTQAALAQKVGVFRETIAALESGRNGVSVRLLSNLASVLGCDESALLRGPSTDHTTAPALVAENGSP